MVKWRVNILCLVGAIIAIITMNLPWLSNSMVLSAVGESPLYLATNFQYTYSFAGGLQWASIIFVLGALIALFTSIGGFIQLAGVSCFIGAVYTIDDPLNRFSIELNIALGVVSASISIISMIKPIGINFKGRTIDTVGRFLTISKAE